MAELSHVSVQCNNRLDLLYQIQRNTTFAYSITLGNIVSNTQVIIFCFRYFRYIKLSLITHAHAKTLLD